MAVLSLPHSHPSEALLGWPRRVGLGLKLPLPQKSGVKIVAISGLQLELGLARNRAMVGIRYTKPSSVGSLVSKTPPT